MLLTIDLPQPLEDKLRDLAGRAGLTAEEFALRLVREAVNGHAPHDDSDPFADIMGPVRREVAQDFSTHDEFVEHIQREIKLARLERKNRS